MQRHLVIIAIAFFSATFAANQPEPCPADTLKDRIIAGFYKKSFFYFAYGDDPKIELDPKTLFGDIEIPATANYTAWRLVPIDGNRVIVFFKDSEKMLYAFYELDDLTDYVNGTARVLQSLDSQEIFELKNADGSAVDLLSFTDDMEWSNGKLLLDRKELSGFSEIKVNSSDNQIVFMAHNPHSCVLFMGEGTLEMERCIDGKKASFVRDANGTRCSYATGALDDFTYVQMLPMDFKINHTSSGYGATTTTTTTTTSPTPDSKDPEKIKPPGNGSSIQRSWTVFLPILVGLFVPLIIVPSS